MKKPYNKPLTPKELAALPDDQIDMSDIPELDEAFWAKANITPPKTKPSVTLRVADDTVNFFKGDDPKGFTGRMAAVLEAYASAQQQK